MHEVTDSIQVRAPGAFTVAFLNTYIKEHLRTSDGPHLQLRLPLQQLDKTATVEVEVSVHVTYLPTGIGQEPQLAIAWDPGDANLFPSFKGTIVATPRKGEGCMLTISGTYNVPHGVVGALFDAAVGIRVAHSTLGELLADLRKAIESDYHERTRWT